MRVIAYQFEFPEVEMRGLHSLERPVVCACVAVALSWPIAARAETTLGASPGSRAASVWAVSFDAPAPGADDVAFGAWRIEWSAEAAPAANVSGGIRIGSDTQASQTRPRAKAIEYSDAYNMRRKIHLYASFATVPLFVTEWVLGQKLYNGTGGESTRGAHGGVAAGLGVLFGVNTVTGVWNMVEGRKDPNHRTKRLVHGILMLAADAGFVATAAMAPGDDDYGEDFTSKRSTHRTVAISSMVTALASYAMMLVGR